MLTAERLREVLEYVPTTGIFYWKVSRGPSWPAGRPAGCINKVIGYCVIRFERKLYFAHRLAWLWMTGEWPKDEIDHRDTDRANNKWANLREATHAENMKNVRRRANNTSGKKGVYRHQNKWRARIRINGIIHHIGMFDDIERAAAEYNLAATRLHGEFARNNEIGV